MFIVHVRTLEGLGKALRKFPTYPMAKEYAEQKADDFEYGTMIYDSLRKIIDTGLGWTTETGEFEPEPFYATRYRRRYE